MIIYLSGCVNLYTKPRKGILQRPEELFPIKTNIMMSYRYAKKETLQRFLNIAKKRKESYAG